MSATRQSLLRDIESIVRDVLDSPAIQLQEDSSPMDFEAWDSVAHVHILVSIENRFAIKFELRETQQWADMRSIVDSIEGKLEAA
ncbi:acyl carrier protein [Tahibacter sp.]|uniref:acyl carrier protein n=1 Tax=Tahibacter sp. TaxID=2056211 RepID=UPI0028C50099|nr:acyl carrier protein [Tahibacter sp.]